MKRIGLIGCGAIGSLIAEAVDEGKINAKLVYVYDSRREAALKLVEKLRSKPKILEGIEEMLRDRRLSIIVEAASDEAVLEYLKPIIEAGKEVLVMSIGGLLFPETRKIYEENASRIHVPAGAIAGLDAVQAISLVGVDRVVLTTRKPPEALAYSDYLKEKRIELDKIREPTLVYEGPVEDALMHFPRSVNVAAALALYSKSGVLVRIIADPTRKDIMHEIDVESKVSNLRIQVENTPHPDNPRTSYLAALSCIQKLREICG
ncbi:MAG: aspartate dehydrogenase [Thermoproteota archaeon]